MDKFIIKTIKPQSTNPKTNSSKLTQEPRQSIATTVVLIPNQNSNETEFQ